MGTVCGNCRDAPTEDVRQVLVSLSSGLRASFLCISCLEKFRWESTCSLCGRDKEGPTLYVKLARKVSGNRMSEVGSVCENCAYRIV
ncbi:MAG: hypothetical protein SV760_01290 [Halobacteria archaeon]|nr:hypothetical protein [Halobacteria archaeon]